MPVVHGARVHAGQEEPSALERDAVPRTEREPNPVRTFHVRGDLPRLRPRTPSSSLRVSHAVRGAFPWKISGSGRPRDSCRTATRYVPVLGSTVGVALPQVIFSSATTTVASSQTRPPSVLRRARISMSPVSETLRRRPSQKTSNVPRVVSASEGTRYGDSRRCRRRRDPARTPRLHDGRRG